MKQAKQHIIIAGFGPIGRAVADGLSKQNVSVAVIDLNAGTVKRQTALGRTILLGDARDASVLRTAGIERAAAVAITIPDASVALEICKQARALAAKGVIIAVRTRHLSQALQAKVHGADIIVVEDIEAANAMEDLLSASLAHSMRAASVRAVRGAGLRTAGQPGESDEADQLQVA
jgi:CPA2 family monovalent cation:H+ antiporter-2